MIIYEIIKNSRVLIELIILISTMLNPVKNQQRS